jgi:acyl-CoA thioester hydrolase
MPAPLEIRIDWSDMDLFGHVNNVAFFRYMQAARVEFCEQAGLTSLNDNDRHSFMVASSKCSFKKPLKFPGLISVITKCDWSRNSSFQLSYIIKDGTGAEVASGEDVLVVYDHHSKVKVNINEELRNRLGT